MSDQPCQACKDYVDKKVADLRYERALIVERLDERWKHQQEVDAANGDALDHRFDSVGKRIGDLQQAMERIATSAAAARSWTLSQWTIITGIAVIGLAAIGLLIDHIAHSH